MCDDCLLTREEAAQLVKQVREGSQSEARARFIEHVVWALSTVDDGELESLPDEEVDRVLWEIDPRVEPSELDESEIEQVREWHELDIGIDAVSVLVETELGKDVHPSELREYVEPEVAD